MMGVRISVECPVLKAKPPAGESPSVTYGVSWRRQVETMLNMQLAKASIARPRSLFGSDTGDSDETLSDWAPGGERARPDRGANRAVDTPVGTFRFGGRAGL
jgi:hypothetical protein